MDSFSIPGIVKPERVTIQRLFRKKSAAKRGRWVVRGESGVSVRIRLHSPTGDIAIAKAKILGYKIFIRKKHLKHLQQKYDTAYSTASFVEVL